MLELSTLQGRTKGKGEETTSPEAQRLQEEATDGECVLNKVTRHDCGGTGACSSPVRV